MSTGHHKRMSVPAIDPLKTHTHRSTPTPGNGNKQPSQLQPSLQPSLLQPSQPLPSQPSPPLSTTSPYTAPAGMGARAKPVDKETRARSSHEFQNKSFGYLKDEKKQFTSDDKMNAVSMMINEYSR